MNRGDALMPNRDHLSEAYARSLDAADSLARFRERFFVPPGTIYLDGSWLIFRGFRAKRIYSGRGDHLR